MREIKPIQFVTDYCKAGSFRAIARSEWFGSLVVTAIFAIICCYVGSRLPSTDVDSVVFLIRPALTVSCFAVSTGVCVWAFRRDIKPQLAYLQYVGFSSTDLKLLSFLLALPLGIITCVGCVVVCAPILESPFFLMGAFLALLTLYIAVVNLCATARLRLRASRGHWATSLRPHPKNRGQALAYLDFRNLGKSGKIDFMLGTLIGIPLLVLIMMISNSPAVLLLASSLFPTVFLVDLFQHDRDDPIQRYRRYTCVQPREYILNRVLFVFVLSFMIMMFACFLSRQSISLPFVAGIALCLIVFACCMASMMDLSLCFMRPTALWQIGFVSLSLVPPIPVLLAAASALFRWRRNASNR